ncbi:MAG: Gfo/Idh/MocA family oxidoreductase [Gaiellaceae bacterium]
MADGQAKVPVAVVGAGNMGRHHARNYHDLPDAELRAVVDVDGARAQEVADQFGVPAFTDVETMLELVPELVAASVAVPTTAHSRSAGTLIEAGKHVLVEKPIASTIEETDRLIRLAEKHSVVLAVGHVERFNPVVRELKRLIASGRMGSVLSLIARRVGVMPPQVKDANVIVDLAVHDIDIFRYLLDGAEPDELYCNAGQAVATDRFDFAEILLRCGPTACFLQVNWLTPVKIRSLAVTGTDGYAELEYVTQRLDFYPARTPGATQSFADVEALSEQEPEHIDFRHEEPLTRELKEFLKAARGEPAETVSGSEARRTMEVAARLVELAERRALSRL